MPSTISSRSRTTSNNKSLNLNEMRVLFLSKLWLSADDFINSELLKKQVLSLIEPVVHRRVSEAKLQLFGEVTSMINSKHLPLEAKKISLSEPSFMDKSDPDQASNSQQRPTDVDVPQQLESSNFEAKDTDGSPASTNLKENRQDSQPKAPQTQPIKLLLSKSKADAFLISLNKSEDQIKSFNKSIRDKTEETKELRTVMMEQLRKMQGTSFSCRRTPGVS